MFSKLFSKKKETIDPQINCDDEKILLDFFVEKYTYANVIDNKIQDKILECINKRERYIYISHEEIKVLNDKLKIQKDFEDRIRFNASINNDGIALEKAGKIELAIEKYEENIKREYPATHSYERLMILYRKKNEYENEIRVIQCAIRVFVKENNHRLERALLGASNDRTKDKIREGHKTCEQVKGEDGWVIYNPYPVHKYEERLQKAINLSVKNGK